MFWADSNNPAFKHIATAELLVLEEETSEEETSQSRRWANQNWAPLALADGKLLIRDQKQMKCVVVR